MVKAEKWFYIVVAVVIGSYALGTVLTYKPKPSFDDYWKRVSSQAYIVEPSGQDCWKSPAEFWRDGGGDCEDFAIALQALVGHGNVVVVPWGVNGRELHALYELNGVYYDAESYRTVVSVLDSNVRASYSIDDIRSITKEAQ